MKIVQLIKPLFAYSIAIPFILLPPAFAGVPFILSNVILELILGSSLISKLVCSVLYGIVTVYAGLSVITALLVSMIFIENLIQFTTKVCDASNNYDFVTEANKNFNKKCQKYGVAQILLNCNNTIFGPFLKNLTFVGILLGTCAGYMTIKMYGKVHFILYLCGPSLTAITFVVAIVFNYLLGLPCKNLKKFKRFWLTKIRKKEDRKICFPLNHVGFN